MKPRVLTLFLLVALGGSAPAEPTLKDGQLRMTWQLFTASLLGGRNNGFAMTCREAGVSSINLEIRDPTGTTTQALTCPGDDSRGELVVTLPHGGRGAYTLSASVPGQAKLRSERIKNAKSGDWVTLRIYVQGCDSDACK